MTAPIGLGDGGIFCGYVSGYKNEDQTALYFDAIADNEDRLRLEVVIGNQGFDDHHKIRLGRYLQSDGSWKSVCDIATATPPEGYNLSLSDGISVQEGLSAVYSKDQFGRVVVHGGLVGQMQNNFVIATLPAGFRPIYTLEMPATCDFTAGRIQVNSAGEIRVITQPSKCNSLYFLAVFVAGG